MNILLTLTILEPRLGKFGLCFARNEIKIITSDQISFSLTQTEAFLWSYSTTELEEHPPVQPSNHKTSSHTDQTQTTLVRGQSLNHLVGQTAQELRHDRKTQGHQQCYITPVLSYMSKKTWKAESLSTDSSKLSNDWCVHLRNEALLSQKCDDLWW